MYLLYGVLCLCLTALLFATTLLAVRNPVRPFWAKEDIFATILMPLLVGLFVLGIASCAKAFLTDIPPTLFDWGYSAMAIGATIGCIKMMDIRNKLARFATEETKTGEIIHFPAKVGHSPDTPINDTPNYRKAA